MMKTLIILDRDGVINQDSDHFVKSEAEFIPLAGSLEAIAQLCQANYSVMVATNQSGIARGLFSLETLYAMHQKLQDLLQPFGGHIDGFYFCPHGPDDQCDCRKPKPGMMFQIAQDFYKQPLYNQLIYNQENASHSEPLLSQVIVVGDSLRDIDAGHAAGCRTVLVKTGKGLRSLKKITEENLSQYKNTPVYNNLAAFTQQLLNSNQ